MSDQVTEITYYRGRDGTLSLEGRIMLGERELTSYVVGQRDEDAVVVTEAEYTEALAEQRGDLQTTAADSYEQRQQRKVEILTKALGDRLTEEEIRELADGS